MRAVAGKQKSIYNQVIEVTQDYLGPAASRFIDRSISNHLNKDPATITVKDLQKLIDWVKVSVAVLTEDHALVNEYIARLTTVIHKNQKK